MSFLPVCGSNFATAGCLLLEFPARPVSAVWVHIYSGLLSHYLGFVWSNQAQISPEFRWSLPLLALPALASPSSHFLPLSAGGRTLTIVSHLLHPAHSPSINDPPKSPLNSGPQPYSSGHSRVKEVISYDSIVLCCIFLFYCCGSTIMTWHCSAVGIRKFKYWLGAAELNDNVLIHRIIVLFRMSLFLENIFKYCNSIFLKCGPPWIVLQQKYPDCTWKRPRKWLWIRRETEPSAKNPSWSNWNYTCCVQFFRMKAWEGDVGVSWQGVTTAVVIKPTASEIKSHSAASLVNPVSNNCHNCEGRMGSDCNENQGNTTHYSCTGGERRNQRWGSDSVRQDRKVAWRGAFTIFFTF